MAKPTKPKAAQPVKPGPNAPKDPSNPTQADIHAAKVVGLRATPADATAASELPNAPKLSVEPLSRADADLIVDNAAPLQQYAPVIDVKVGFKMADLIASATTTKAKLDLAERMQGSADAARTNALAAVDALATQTTAVVAEVGSAKGVDMAKAFVPLLATRAQTQGVAKRKRTVSRKRRAATKGTPAKQ